MKNKCPNCGFECDKTDLFCAKCGYKFTDQDRNVSLDLDSEIEELKKTALDNAKEFLEERKALDKANGVFFNSNGRFTNNSLLYYTFCLLIAAAFFGLILFSSLSKQNEDKMILTYKNYMNNPSQIPELREPSSVNELKNSLLSVENFLLLYLKYSTDSQVKKEQVFSMFLKEMEKMPHLSNESLVKDDTNSCGLIQSSSKVSYCIGQFNTEFKKIGLKTFDSKNTLYFYPDYKFINDKYSKYLSKDMKKYLSLKEKYNDPVVVDTEVKISPKKLADKIVEFENLYLSTNNAYIKESIESILYNDCRSFIFSTAVYATTTQEMTPVYQKAYKYFISKYHKSAFRPIIMSCLEQKRSYDEETFKKDYPYKLFDNDDLKTLSNAALSDVFVQLRKSIFNSGSNSEFTYIYNANTAVWSKYDKKVDFERGNYILGDVDENNNIDVYNNTLSLVQELNVPKYSRLFFYNNKVYLYNSDKLSISRLQFNGKQFSYQELSNYDITSLFPGIEVINIDSYSNYNLAFNKDNRRANYIILSRYSTGFDQYSLTPVRGDITPLLLPNMFEVSSMEDVVVSFHAQNIDPQETSDSVPTYKFTIHTTGYVSPEENLPPEQNFANYDEQTAIEEENASKHEPNMMPKIEEKIEVQESVNNPPAQKIEPPKEEEN